MDASVSEPGAHGLHEIWPTRSVKVPAVHGLHAVAEFESSSYRPILHSVQFLAPFVSRFTFYVFSFQFYVLRFTFYGFRLSVYVLRFTIYICRKNRNKRSIIVQGWVGSGRADDLGPRPVRNTSEMN